MTNRSKPSCEKVRWTLTILCLMLLFVWRWTTFSDWHDSPSVYYWGRYCQLWLIDGKVEWIIHDDGVAGPVMLRCTANGSDIGWMYGTGLTFNPPSSSSHGSIPLWLPPVLVAIPTAILWYRDRNLKRQPPGHCKTCGYNLTGNTSGICPECGAPIPEAMQKKLALVECGSTEDQPIDRAKQEVP